MTFTIAAATNVPRSQGTHQDDTIKVNTCTNRSEGILAVMDDCMKPDNPASDSPSEGKCMRFAALKLASTNIAMQIHVMHQRL
jgi:hypothetical protein